MSDSPLVSAALNAESAPPFSHIPIIDLQHLRSPDPELRQALVRSVRDACMSVGFFYVKNHGIPQPVIDQVIDASKAYFALPLEVKMKLDNRENAFKGYHALFSGNNDHSNKGKKDMHEGFEFGWEDFGHFVQTATIPEASETSMPTGVNVWPDPSDAPGFRKALLTYYHAAVSLGRTLFPLFALALDLQEGWFDNKTRHSAALMKVHTPSKASLAPIPARSTEENNHRRESWECFTILYQPMPPAADTPAALQVLNPNIEWVDAPAIEGTLVVNLGDQFSRWTNDVFKSIIHRALTPPIGQSRYSIPLFFGTDYDVRLEPIPSCVSPERPVKYETITAGEYVKSRFKATYEDGHY